MGETPLGNTQHMSRHLLVLLGARVAEVNSFVALLSQADIRTMRFFSYDYFLKPKRLLNSPSGYRGTYLSCYERVAGMNSFVALLS